MKAWRFTFEGMALGGEAVVIAETAEEARDTLMRAHPDLEDVCQEIEGQPPTGIVHFWDGDY